MNSSTLTAVVLNWRTPDNTLRAVRALIGDGVPPHRIVVVDNASDDGSADRFRAELPEIEVLALEANTGFARGNNFGANALPGDAYLFVNSDAFVLKPGSVDRLLGALDDPTVGIAVPRLRNQDLTLQPSVVPISTPLPELIRASGLTRFIPNRFQPSCGTYWDHAASRAIQSAIGAVLLIRGSTYMQLGGYNERRYMYGEDLEMFRRAASNGWLAWFVADAEFEHLGGLSAGKRWAPAERAELVARAEATIIHDYMGPLRAHLTVGLMGLGAAIRVVFHRLRGNRRDAELAAAWLRGYVGGGRFARVAEPRRAQS